MQKPRIPVHLVCITVESGWPACLTALEIPRVGMASPPAGVRRCNWRTRNAGYPKGGPAPFPSDPVP